MTPKGSNSEQALCNEHRGRVATCGVNGHDAASLLYVLKSSTPAGDYEKKGKAVTGVIAHW